MGKQSPARGRGRPPRLDLTPELCEEILLRMRKGESKAAIARAIGLPTSTLYHWSHNKPTAHSSEAERERTRSVARFQAEARKAQLAGQVYRWEWNIKHKGVAVDALREYDRRSQADVLAYLERSASQPKRKHPWMP